MTHHHCHTHHYKATQLNRLLWVFILTALYMVLEFIGGWISGSMALLADAAHMLGDSASLGLALMAVWIAIKRPPSDRRTFGYDRTEVLAALANGLILIVLACVIFKEALERFASPEPIQAGLMLWVAAGGLVVNIIAAFILHNHQQHSLNMRGAYLHVLSDRLGSISAMVAGVLIMLFGSLWVDPLVGTVVALLVLSNALRLVKDALDVLMESAPDQIQIPEIENTLLGMPDVKTVHNLHVWSVNTGKVVLTAHLVVVPGAYTAEMLSKTQRLLKETFGLSHVTLQLEEG